MIRASTPGKLVVAGAFVVLDGAPGIGLAVSPRLGLALSEDSATSWPAADPFARAALRAVGLDPAHPPSLAVRSGFPMPVAGWSLGSSAAHVTALVAALSRWSGRALAGDDLVRAAREAHREAQGGVGSGLDVACCALGGAVVLLPDAGGGPSAPRRLCWPDGLGVVVVRSPSSEGTPDRVRRYLQAPAPADAGPLTRLVAAIGALIEALATGADVLGALAEVGIREGEWSAATVPDLAPEALPAVSTAAAPFVARGDASVKSLGAGDAVGVFLDRDRLSEGEVLEALARAGLDARAVAPDVVGTVVTG
jgi:phosphomevalonate kinase